MKSKIGYLTFLAILIVTIIIVPLASAEVKTGVSDHNLVVSAYNPVMTVPVAPPTLSMENQTKKDEVMREQDRLNELQKSNLTSWQRKLETELVSLLESDSYIRTGKISEQDMAMLKMLYTVIPSDQVSARLGISKPTSDLFLVSIRVNRSASVHVVDPYIVTDDGTVDDIIYSWVELKNLQSIASLEPVIQIFLTPKPITRKWVPIEVPTSDSGNSPENFSSSSAHNGVPVISSTNISRPPENVSAYSQITTATTVPASSMSVMGISIALVVTGIILLRMKLRERDR
jgi:hypothetical protein